MSTIIRSAVLAIVVAAGASSAIAQSSARYDNDYRYGNSQQSDRAFWDRQQRHGQ